MGRTVQTSRKNGTRKGVVRVDRVDQKNRVDRVADDSDKTFSVRLGTKKACLFAAKSGTKIAAKISGFVKEANAFVIVDTKDNEMLLVPRSYIPASFKKGGVPIVADRNLFGFEHEVGKKHTVAFGPQVYDANGDLLSGKKTRATVLKHIRNAGQHWYIIRYPSPHYDETDPNNWWTGFDIRLERNMK